MKCTNCGLPLSPTNKSSTCPRCHATLTSGPKAAVVSSSQQYNTQDRGEPGETPKASWEQEQPLSFSPSPQWKPGAPPNQFSFPPAAQTPFPQPGQMWQPVPTPTPPSLPTPAPMEAAARGNSAPDLPVNHKERSRFSATKPVPPSRRPQTSNFGFIVAGLFVISGGLLLIFVHFMALGLSSTGTASVYAGTSAVTRNSLPSPTTTAAAPTLVPSPTTGAFPGQQYIDNPQTATSVNTTTAQPLQKATSFKANQKVYVTFNIHPNGKIGAVCLFWYLNNKFVTQYPFAVTVSANAGYSYAVYGGTGQAYIDIYWASTIACSDKILAQRVNFTIIR